MLYGRKWREYALQFDAMTINNNRRAEFIQYARQALKDRARYMEIQTATGVPWPYCAVVHRRESDSNFGTYLGNGDSLKRRTVNVPKGRGPFATFLAGAIDALHYDRIDQVIDWRWEKIFFWLEEFNGEGYNNRGLPDPYLWGGTNIQVRGRYKSDGKFAPTSWDMQPGCVPILWLMREFDPSIDFIRET